MQDKNRIIPVNQEAWDKALNRTIEVISRKDTPSIFIYESCTSTMDIGKSLLGRGDYDNFDPENNARLIAQSSSVQDKDNSYAWVFSLSQTKGRGRSQRSWHSAASGGMYFSLIDLKGQSITATSGLPLAIGLAVHEAFQGIGLQTGLKWPNDVLMKHPPHKKISGILIESLITGEGEDVLCHPIIGVGINILQTEFPLGIPATSLFLEKQEPDLNYIDICMYFASAIHKSYLSFLTTGFNYIKEKCWDASLLKGARVTTETPVLKGVVVGISDSGSLIVDVEDEVSGAIETTEIHAGDVRCTYDFVY